MYWVKMQARYSNHVNIHGYCSLYFNFLIIFSLPSLIIFSLFLLTLFSISSWILASLQIHQNHPKFRSKLIKPIYRNSDPKLIKHIWIIIPIIYIYIYIYHHHHHQTHIPKYIYIYIYIWIIKSILHKWRSTSSNDGEKEEEEVVSTGLVKKKKLGWLDRWISACGGDRCLW